MERMVTEIEKDGVNGDRYIDSHIFFSFFFNFLKKKSRIFFPWIFSRIFGENFKSQAQKITELLDFF